MVLSRYVQTESLVAVAELSAVTGGHMTPLSVEEWVVEGERGQKFAVVTVFGEKLVFVKGEWVYCVTVVRCAGGDEGDHSEATETGTESLKQ